MNLGSRKVLRFAIGLLLVAVLLFIPAGTLNVVRHPMYLGSLLMWLATPLALGSYLAWPAFALRIPLYVFRLLNEEKVLLRELPGYSEYCNCTRYRLVPLA